MMAHYLRAVEAIGSDQDGAATVAEMKTMLANGFYSHGGHVRPDAQLSTTVYLVQVKTPKKSRSKWDVYKILATSPGDEPSRRRRRTAS